MFWPSGLMRGPEDQDDVVEDGVDLRVALRGDELVGELDGVLRRRRLRRSGGHRRYGR